MLSRHTNLLRIAAANVIGHGAAYGSAAAGLGLGLTLLLSGIAISEGVKSEALRSVAAGADVYCTWDRFGRDGPLPRERLDELAAIPGVIRVVPRIVGRVRLGDEHVIVLGVPLATLDAVVLDVDGAVPASPAEVLVGVELARALDRAPGAHVALEGDTVRVFTISGVVASTTALWSTKAVVCDLEEAALVFGDRTHVTDACLFTRPGYAAAVAEAVGRLDRRYRVQNRDLVRAYVHRGMTRREGVFTVLFALTLVLAVPAFAITTWLGHAPRRVEIGLLKAEGWRTADVLEMVAMENVLVSLGVATAALLLAMLWVRGLGGPFVAPFFLTELPRLPHSAVPARFVPVPVVLAFLFSLVVTMTGGIAATWHTAITRPVEVLR